MSSHRIHFIFKCSNSTELEKKQAYFKSWAVFWVFVAGCFERTNNPVGSIYLHLNQSHSFIQNMIDLFPNWLTDQHFLAFTLSPNLGYVGAMNYIQSSIFLIKKRSRCEIFSESFLYSMKLTLQERLQEPDHRCHIGMNLTLWPKCIHFLNLSYLPMPIWHAFFL